MKSVPALVFIAVLALLVPVPRAWSEDGPDSAGNGYERALALLKEGIVFEAIHELERLASVYPDHEEGRMLLARSLYRVKRDARAAEEASHVLRINEGNIEARRLLTRIRAEAGQRLDRKDPAAVLQYARLCAVPGSYDRAADFYRLALSLDDEATVHLEFARMLYWAGRNAESAYHYERFLEANPGNADAFSEAGRVYNASGRFPLAISAFDAGLKLRPGDLEMTFAKIQALIWSGREAEAEALLQALIRKQVGGDRPLMLRASIARIQGRILDEYVLLGHVVEAYPDNGDARLRMVELERGTAMGVARLLDRLERDPANTEVRRHLVDLYVSESRFGEAIHHLDLIVQRVPDDPGVQALLRQLRAEESRRVMERVEWFHRMREDTRRREMDTLNAWLKRNAGDMRSRLLLAELHIEEGGYNEAVTHLEWLSAANPGNVQILQALSRVQYLMRERGGTSGETTESP